MGRSLCTPFFSKEEVQAHTNRHLSPFSVYSFSGGFSIISINSEQSDSNPQPWKLEALFPSGMNGGHCDIVRCVDWDKKVSHFPLLLSLSPSPNFLLKKSPSNFLSFSSLLPLHFYRHNLFSQEVKTEESVLGIYPRISLLLIKIRSFQLYRISLLKKLWKRFKVVGRIGMVQIPRRTRGINLSERGEVS